MGAPLGIAALGLATPIGIGKAAVAPALFAGTRSGLASQRRLVDGRIVHVGAIDAALPAVPEELAAFDCRNNRLMLLALREITEEIEAAKLRHGRDRVAVILGTSTAGIAEGEAAYAQLTRTGTWPRGYGYRQQETGNLAEFAARALGLTGVAFTLATACSSTGKVFATARRLIRQGLCDAAVVGGADTLSHMTLNGFAALEAMSHGLCSPFSANRDGINIGEAAVAFLVGPDAAIELRGVGESSDAHHMSAPDPDGLGAFQAMAAALRDAALEPDQIAYLNLHGTATALNDAMEGKAVHALFGGDTPCSSTKAMTGHTLGAASACEAAFLWLTLHPGYNPAGLLPPHLWDGMADPSIPPLALVAPNARVALDRPLSMLSNSFAFGGNNVALVLGRP